MTPALTTATIVVAAVLAGWSAWFVVRDRPVILRQLYVAGAVAVLVLVEAVVAGVRLAGGAHVTEPGELWGYVATAVVVPVLAGLVAFAERTRWSSVVMLVAAVTSIVLQLRLVQIWNA